MNSSRLRSRQRQQQQALDRPKRQGLEKPKPVRLEANPKASEQILHLEDLIGVGEQKSHVRFTADLPKMTHQRLRVYAALKGVAMIDVVLALLDNSLPLLSVAESEGDRPDLRLQA